MSSGASRQPFVLLFGMGTGGDRDLAVLVALEGDSIVVTIPGTSYSVTYRKGNRDCSHSYGSSSAMETMRSDLLSMTGIALLAVLLGCCDFSGPQIVDETGKTVRVRYVN